MIKVALVDKHPVICDALSALLLGIEDIAVTGISLNKSSTVIRKNESEKSCGMTKSLNC